eukprot:2597752-Amphidinium_carterae.1
MSCGCRVQSLLTLVRCIALGTDWNCVSQFKMCEICGKVRRDPVLLASGKPHFKVGSSYHGLNPTRRNPKTI